jgi:hypothetical protein
MRSSLVATLVLGGCVLLDTGVVQQGSTGDVDTTSSSSSGTTVVEGSTSSGASSSGETSSSSSSSSSSGSSDSSSGESTGVDSVESPCGAEQKICAVVELEGEPAGVCGDTLDVKGIVQLVEPGVWEVEDCDVCELCGGPTYTIEFVAPMEWLPSDPPVCARVAVEYAPMDVTPWACSFIGVAIWADDGVTEESAPRYVGRSIETSAPAGVSGLYVVPEILESERCNETDCCWMAPGKYTLLFSGAGIGDPLVVGEKQTVTDVQAWNRTYDVHVERSHAHKECGKIPHFDWVFKR